MSSSLEIYLHDHLAAAAGAIDLLRTWQEDEQQPAELRAFATDLLARVEQDRDSLQRIADRLGNSPHSVKEAAGWMAGKLSRFKLNRRDHPALSRLEGMEMLALGILGKLALWRSLATLPPDHPAVRGVELAHLVDRATQQHREVESRRLSAALDALR